jgi:hypothetical protein
MIKDKISIDQFKQHLAETSNIMGKAIAITLVRLGQDAEKWAKQNVAKNFGKGSKDTIFGKYTLSGALMGSIYNRFEKKGKDLTMWIGSRGVVYARIHEMAENGISTTVKVKNRKFLWLRLAATNNKGSPFRRLSPTDFYLGAKKAPLLTGFYYGKSDKGNLFAMVKQLGKKSGEGIPLFMLRKSVTIKPRPYLAPALMMAKKKYPSYYREELRKLMGGK